MRFPRRKPIRSLRVLCLALMLPVAALIPRAVRSQLDSKAQTSPQFAVAAIHPHIPEPHEHNSVWSSPFDGKFKAENMSVVMLIHWAYELPETRILGAPQWASSTYFNIDARTDPSLDDKLRGLSADDGRQLKEKMVQALLADRFKLVTHTETRNMPIYALVVAKGGAKLGDIKPGGNMVNYGGNHLEVLGSNSTALLAEVLAKEVGRPVVDQTGISGRYELKLKWTPDDSVSTVPIESNLPPSIFTALQEQLGLKLESQKGPVQVLIVDHVEVPSAN